MIWIIWLLVALMIFAGVQMVFSSLFVIDYHIFRRIRRCWRKWRMNRMRKAAFRMRARSAPFSLKRKNSELPTSSLPSVRSPLEITGEFGSEKSLPPSNPSTLLQT
jgi:hypothetical protein